MVEGGAGYPIPIPQGIGRVLVWWMLGKELKGVFIPNEFREEATAER